MPHGAFTEQCQCKPVGDLRRWLQTDICKHLHVLLATLESRFHGAEHVRQARRPYLRPLHPRLKVGLPHGPPERQRAPVVDRHRLVDCTLSDRVGVTYGFAALEKKIASVAVCVTQADIESGQVLRINCGDNLCGPGQVSGHPEVLCRAGHILHEALHRPLVAAILDKLLRLIFIFVMRRKGGGGHHCAHGRRYPCRIARPAVEEVRGLLPNRATPRGHAAPLEGLLCNRLEDSQGRGFQPIHRHFVHPACLTFFHVRQGIPSLGGEVQAQAQGVLPLSSPPMPRCRLDVIFLKVQRLYLCTLPAGQAWHWQHLRVALRI
mmetsp:Transcript_46768/g.102133  ORF Transcript_46768/g.102133 Transcript_46768/m.102133 type:complete len:320 (-) Transcript_46768:125-1084(-)